MAVQIVGGILVLAGVFLWRKAREENRATEQDIHELLAEEYERGRAETLGNPPTDIDPGDATDLYQTTIVWYVLASVCLTAGIFSALFPLIAP